MDLLDLREYFQNFYHSVGQDSAILSQRGKTFKPRQTPTQLGREFSGYNLTATHRSNNLSLHISFLHHHRRFRSVWLLPPPRCVLQPQARHSIFFISASETNVCVQLGFPVFDSWKTGRAKSQERGTQQFRGTNEPQRLTEILTHDRQIPSCCGGVERVRAMRLHGVCRVKNLSKKNDQCLLSSEKCSVWSDIWYERFHGNTTKTSFSACHSFLFNFEKAKFPRAHTNTKAFPSSCENSK